MTDRKSGSKSNPAQSGNPKVHAPAHKGGDAQQNAEHWGGGSKGSKGGVSAADKRNPNSSAKS